MKFNIITQTQYEEARYQFLLTTEERGAVALRPYVDSRGYITIGIGFNLNSPNVRAAVLAALGVQRSGTDADLYQQLTRVLSASYAPGDTAAARELDNIMASRSAGSTFGFATEVQVKAVFTTLALSYEAIVSNKTPGIPAYSIERVALYSIAYNTTNGNGLGKNLQSAIAGGNRAEAWFEIRYNTNPVSSDSPGLAKRRYYEAQTLGLYNQPGNVTVDEAKQTYAMFSKHRDAILSYEILYGTRPDSASAAIAAQRIASANSDYHLSGNDAVQTLYAALIPARNAFITWLNKQLPSGEAPLATSNWNPAAIAFNGLASSLTALDARSLDGKGNGMDKNLLVGGDGVDELYGGAGADVLFGGDNDDRLEGGAGDDTMYGGKGEDTYVVRLSDGVQHDRIVDSDGKGRIIVLDADGNVLNTIVLTKDGSAETWKDKDGKVTISHNSPWKMTLADGSVIELGDNFDAKAFGITLADAPVETTTSFIGDFVKKLDPADPKKYLVANDNYVADGTQAGAADIITGSAAADNMRGLGGNDALAGLGGDDVLDGGDGDDVLLGGAGADTLTGGNGDDFLFGAGIGELVTPTSTTYSGAVAYGPEIARGFSWVAYQIDATRLFGRYQINGGAQSNVADDAGNIIDGGPGNDRMYGGSAADVLHGGADDDFLEGFAGGDALFGDDGNDVIVGDSEPARTPGDQQGNDLLVGGAGDDTLYGQGGNDQLSGGTGDDYLFGDIPDPDFTLPAFHGNDFLDGGDGDDHLYGGGKDDTLTGGAGNDFLYGDDLDGNLAGQYHGSDYLDGGGGKDYLEGGGKDDRLFGGDGDDTLLGDSADAGASDGDSGKDDLDGGAGDDLLIGGLGDDYLWGGEGNDQLQGDDTLLTDASGGADHLDGGAGDDVLAGQGGDDVLIGGDGSDQLIGGAGNDTLIGGSGADAMAGGAGDDTYIIEAGDLSAGLALASESVFDNEGRNTIVVDGLDAEDLNVASDGAGQLVLDWTSAVEPNPSAMSFSAAAATTPSSDQPDLAATQTSRLVIIGGGTTLANAFKLGGNAVLSTNGMVGQFAATTIFSTDASGRTFALGGRNADSIISKSAYATLSGGRGDDLLIAQGGDETFLYEYGDGHDVIAESGPVRHADGSAVVNRIKFGAGIAASDLVLGDDDGWFSIQVGANPLDKITFSGFDPGGTAPAPVTQFDFADGTSTTYSALMARGLSGTAGDDVLIGTGAGDIIDGQSGNDALSGGRGNDSIFGGDGDDAISGGEGNDTLEGGAGLDALLGDAGDDTLLSDGQDYLDGGEGDDTYRIGVRSEVAVATIDDGSGLNTVYLQGDTGAARRVFTQDGQLYASVDGSNLVAIGENALLSSLVFKSDAGDPGQSAQAIIDGTSSHGLARSGRWVAGTGVIFTEDVTSAQQIVGGSRAAWLQGGTGADEITGGTGSELIDGGAGNDEISGGAGADTIRGGQGNDTLKTADSRGSNDSERDLFLFGRGDGADLIKYAQIPEGGVKDLIRFDLGISRSDITVEITSSSDSFDGLPRLTIGYGGGDKIFLEAGAEGTISGVSFADGSSLSMADLLTLVPSNGGQPVVTAVDTLLVGTPGADVLRGRAGNDTLRGEGGDDRLVGGSGKNTYQFSSTSGHDLITATAGEHATLEFSDINPADVKAKVESGNIVILTGAASSVVVTGINSLLDFIKSWSVQFGAAPPMTLQSLLQDHALDGDSSLDDRSSSFMSEQRAELVELPARLPGSGFITPTSVLSQSIDSGDANGITVVPDYLVLQETTQRTVTRSLVPTYEAVNSLNSNTVGGSRYVPLNSVTSGGQYADTSGWIPVHAGLKQELTGWFVPMRSSTPTQTQTVYRISGYEEVETFYDIAVPVAAAIQSRVVGTSGADRVSGDMRGIVSSFGGDDTIILAGPAIEYAVDYGYFKQYSHGSDWAPFSLQIP